MINPFKYKIIPQISIITNIKYPNKIITEKIYCSRNKKDNKYFHKIYINNKFMCSFLGYWCSVTYMDEFGQVHSQGHHFSI